MHKVADFPKLSLLLDLFRVCKPTISFLTSCIQVSASTDVKWAKLVCVSPDLPICILFDNPSHHCPPVPPSVPICNAYEFRVLLLHLVEFETSEESLSN